MNAKMKKEDTPKKVVQYIGLTKDGYREGMFNSWREAADYIGCAKSSVINAYKKNHRVYGYKIHKLFKEEDSE